MQAWPCHQHPAALNTALVSSRPQFPQLPGGSIPTSYRAAKRAEKAKGRSGFWVWFSPLIFLSWKLEAHKDIKGHFSLIPSGGVLNRVASGFEWTQKRAMDRISHNRPSAVAQSVFHTSWSSRKVCVHVHRVQPFLCLLSCHTSM